MWKDKRTDNEASSEPVPETLPRTPVSDARPEPSRTPGKTAALLGRTLSFKGELHGQEDLIVDGEFEGSLKLGENSLTVGPQGRVQADADAREIIIQGTVRGKLHASDRLQITRSGNVMGELIAARIVIEDGAYFKGSIDIQKPGEQKAAAKGAVSESFRASAVPSVMAAKKDN